jgi:hypothetical protein
MLNNPGTIMPRDFTLERYRELCRALQKDYVFYTVYRYLSEKPESNVVVMRHDVDRNIMNALRMAEVEQDLGICSTYYFRYPITFRPDIIRKIQTMGHEIGYHYEVLSKTKGDFSRAISLFQSEIQEFRKICEINTICMHGGPLSRFDNRDIWKQFSFKELGVFGEAYLSLSDLTYFSDTGRNWAGHNNMRDHLRQGTSFQPCTTTNELIYYLKQSQFARVYLTVHPERWNRSGFGWLASYCIDAAVSMGKKILVVIYR